MTHHWPQDPYWTEALDRFRALRESGAKKLTIELDAFLETLFNDDGPAYQAFEAMRSVQEHEGSGSSGLDVGEGRSSHV
jgi:hypothetical protein